MSTEKLTTSKILIVAFLTTLVSAIVNIIIFMIGDTFRAFDGFEAPQPDGSTAALTIFVPPISTFAFMVIGTIGFFILYKGLKVDLTRIRIVAIIVLILSFVLPLTVSGAPVSAVILLELMHLMTGLIVIPNLTGEKLYSKF